MMRIDKGSVTELRKLNNPPHMVKDVMEIVCILFNIKPEKLQGGAVDYWPAAVKNLFTSKNFFNNIL